jgi:hypothetical protein
MLLSLLAAAVVLAATPAFAAQASPAAPGCASFSSQAEAQDRFGDLGGSPGQRVGSLDPDRDGVACEGLPGPYKGYATVAYSLRRGFFFGTASMPREGGGGFACLEGNRHFDDGPRLLTLFRVRPGRDLTIRDEIGAAARPGSGRLLWKAEQDPIAPGRYYVVFEARQYISPYGPNQCPGFRSPEFALPKLRRSPRSGRRRPRPLAAPLPR